MNLILKSAPPCADELQNCSITWFEVAMLKVRSAVVAVSLVAAASIGAVGQEAAATNEVKSRGLAAIEAPRAAFKRGAVLSASMKQANEGDRYSLTAVIKSPRKALTVALEKLQAPLYSGDDVDWLPIRKTKVGGRGKVSFAAVAVDNNSERYRVIVGYKKAKPSISNAVNVTVWRWIPLKEYSPYYGTGDTTFGTFALNGRAYTGWGPWAFSHIGTWEARFTPGRRCTSFRGVVGLADVSADGSSGTVAFTADDTDIYQSPTLTPGMTVSVSLPLAKPYRFGIRINDTTSDDTTGRDDVEAWPAVGDPAFLCTGV